MTDKTNKIGSIMSILFVLLVTLGFGALWYSSKNTARSDTSSTTVDVVQTEALAEKILADRDNLAGMPVSAPIGDSVGKTNPFQ